MVSVYPNLTAEIAKRGIKKAAVANAIDVTYRTFLNKMMGISSFTWEETCIINRVFLPDMDKDTIFARNTQ